MERFKVSLPTLRQAISLLRAKGRGPLPERIAEAMDLPAGEEVVIRRRRLFDRESGRLEEIGASYLPVSVAGGTVLEKPGVLPKALFRCVEEFTGRQYTTALDRWIARLASSEEAGTFDLPSGAPVLHVIHTARDENGDILEVSESIWPADRVMFLDEYDIPADAEPEDPKESQT